jgi:hypothetical protein
MEKRTSSETSLIEAIDVGELPRPEIALQELLHPGFGATWPRAPPGTPPVARRE